MLCTTHSDFPLQAWGHLLPQAEITVNLLRGSNCHPSKSAWESMHGKRYDFDKHPIAPVGTKVVAFEGPEQRGTWAPHGIDGFYTGPALSHYRCYTVFIPTTVTTRVVDTLTWFPSTCPMPPLTPSDMLRDAQNLLQDTLRITKDDHYVPTTTQHPPLRESLSAIVSLATTLLATPSIDATHPVTPTPPTTADSPYITSEQHMRVQHRHDQKQEQYQEQRVEQHHEQRVEQHHEQRVVDVPHQHSSADAHNGTQLPNSKEEIEDGWTLVQRKKP